MTFSITDSCSMRVREAVSVLLQNCAYISPLEIVQRNEQSGPRY